MVAFEIQTEADHYACTRTVKDHAVMADQFQPLLKARRTKHSQERSDIRELKLEQL